MMTFPTFSVLALMVLLTFFGCSNASFVVSTTNIRGGGESDWSTSISHHVSDRGRRVRRHLLEKNDLTCLLVRKDIQYQNHDIAESHNWACEIEYEEAMAMATQVNGRQHGAHFIDIVDVPTEDIDRLGAISGGSIFKTPPGAYIEESLDDTTAPLTLHVPEDAEMEVVALEREHDSRHYKQRRQRQRQRRRRNAADAIGQHHHASRDVNANPGRPLSVLVIRVVDAAGAQLAATNEQLKDDIFTDDFSLTTGYAACSHNQLILEPAVDDTDDRISEGITTLTLTENVTATATTMGTLQDAVLGQAFEDYGNLPALYDLVMVCQPPGSGEWSAYAYTNSWLSVYNDVWCQMASAQMHEVGHNLGLGHANQLDTAYGDQSSLMGSSFNSDDGPRMCFNAVNNFQLGWYDQQKDSFDPLENLNSVHNFVLNGVNDYQKEEGTNNGELITLRLVEFGEEYDTNVNAFGNDYYIGYNHNVGINSGTVEAINMVVVFRKELGGPNEWGESNRIADLNPGESYTIPNFKGTTVDVNIRVLPYENQGRDAPIEISMGTELCGGSEKQFQIEINTDRYSAETSWAFMDNTNSDAVIASAPKENHAGYQQYVYPNDGTDYYCLEDDTCYTFKIQDAYSDGFLPNDGGNYKLYLNNEVLKEGGSADTFQAEELYSFCVAAPTTASPSMSPTNEPTLAPVPATTLSPVPASTLAPVPAPTLAPVSVPDFEEPECTPDTEAFRYKGIEKRTCAWLASRGKEKLAKLCRRSDQDPNQPIQARKKLFVWCPQTCAAVGKGPCATANIE